MSSQFIISISFSLTEASVRNGSMPVAMPDFTRGAWRKVEGFSHAMAE